MKTQKSIITIILLSAVLIISGCYGPWHRVDGNYTVVTETRQLSSFDRVINEGEFDVYILQDGLSEVEIEAESNLIPLIRTRIQGSSLVIDTKDNLRNNYPMKLYVHTKDIREARLSGSGMIHADGINTGDFEASISGSGDVFISGNANDVDISLSGSGSMHTGLNCNNINANISGSGEIELYGNATKGDFVISGSGSIRAYELNLPECYAKISGSGSMYLNVQDYLNVIISGSGNVYYLGTPVIETKITGSGSVIHP